MDKLDLARVRIAVEDHAADYYGGPWNFGRSDAARYTAEGHLGRLCDQHGLKVVWQAVAAVIDERPELLTAGKEQRHARELGREGDCRRRAQQALDAYRAGCHAAALAEIDAGELVDPDYTSAGWSWDRMRQQVVESVR